MYENAFDVFILYTSTLLSLFITYNGLFMGSLGFSLYRIKHLQTDYLTFILLICMSFISFSCLIDLAKTSGAM
jgi:hypothetical protein